MDIRIIGETKGAPRDTQWHKKIVKSDRIPGTKTGNNVWLECGHRVQTFGDLSHTGGVVLCQECLASRGEA